MRHRRTLAALAAIAVLATGCKLDLTLDVRLMEDGAAQVALLADVDAALLAELDGLGVDPTAELVAAAADSGWEIDRRPRDDGGVTIALTRALAEAAEVGPALRELGAGLDDVDPALLVDLEADVDAADGARVEGTALLRPPSSAGMRLDGLAVGPDAEALAALTEEALDAQLRIEVPGSVLDRRGGRMEGRTAVWELPVGVPVEIGLQSAAPAWWQRTWVLWASGGAGGLVLIAIVAAVLRRRRSGVRDEG